MIQFETEVTDYLDHLVIDLYDNEYFGFVESSDLFVDKLIDYIYENLETFPARKTPYKIQYLGTNYIF
jgi:hypothetical protein